jgi:hypothetical protein
MCVVKIFSYEEIDPKRLANALTNEGEVQVRMNVCRARIFFRLTDYIDIMMGRSKESFGKIAEIAKMVRALFLFIRIALRHSRLFGLVGLYIEYSPRIDVDYSGGFSVITVSQRTKDSRNPPAGM